jgi:hypothetical protein
LEEPCVVVVGAAVGVVGEKEKRMRKIERWNFLTTFIEFRDCRGGGEWIERR